MKNRVKRIAKPRVGEDHEGFWAGTMWRDHHLVLTKATEESLQKEKERKVHADFIDLEKAYT